MTALADALRTLGTMEPDAIAAMLAAEHVTGWRGCPDTCVLANYLSITTGEEISVGTLTAKHRYREWDAVIMPTTVCDFIDAFDRGAYPALEAAGPLETTSAYVG